MLLPLILKEYATRIRGDSATQVQQDKAVASCAL